MDKLMYPNIAPETFIQHNIILLEYSLPKAYTNLVYEYLTKYSGLPIEEQYSILMQLTEHLKTKNLSINSMVEILTKPINDIDVILLARVNALTTLAAMASVDYSKPFSWWKEVSMQGIDVQNPVSETKH